MASKVIYAGSTIKVSITFNVDVSTLDNVYVYLYTSEQKPFKFYLGEKTGFYQAVLLESNKIMCLLTTEMTKYMSGELYYDSLIKDTVSGYEDNGTVKVPLGINIKNCLSKDAK